MAESPTEKELKSQEELSKKQKQAYDDTRKALKEQIKQQLEILKIQKEGTKEYKDAIKKIEDSKKGLRDVFAQTKEGLSLQNKRGKIEKERMPLTSDLTKRVMGMNDQQRKQIGYLGEVHNLHAQSTKSIMEAAEAQHGFSDTGEDLSKTFGISQAKLDEIGSLIEQVVEPSGDLSKNAVEMAEGFDSVGTDDFKSMTADMEAQFDAIEAKNKSILSQLGAMSNVPPEYIALIESEAERHLAAAKALKIKSKDLDRVDEISKSLGKSFMAPFEGAKGLIESLPFGDQISTLLNLDAIMGEFGKTVNDNLKGFAMGEIPLDQAVQNLAVSGLATTKVLMSGFGQFFKMLLTNPIVGMIALFTATGIALKSIFDGAMETRKELGLSFIEAAKLQSTINLTAVQFKLLGVSGEDVAAITDGIRANLGGTTKPTAEIVKGFTSLVATTGISGENVTKLATQMMAVGASSQEAAMSQIESVAALARANDVAPGDILNDIASDTDLFASFAQDGGRNLAMAAITAKKLGLEMATVSKITDSLLNFEESINAQMEAQMLTGRSINTDKARELALAGDLDGMQREITSQIGSAADFEAMNVVQRRALADAFGVSVGELSKMITNQDKLNNMTEGEKKSRDMIAEIMKFIGGSMSALLSLAKAMIPAFVALGAVIAVVFYPVTLTIAGVVALGKAVEFLNTKFEYAGTILASLVGLATAFALKMKLAGTNVGGGLLNSLKAVGTSIKDKLGGSKGVTDKVTDVTTPDGDMGKKIEKGGKGIGKGMKGLAKGVGAFANPKVILGLAALTAAVIGVGFALKLAAPGIKAFGEAMGTIIKSIATGISTVIGAIGDFAVKLMTIASPSLALGLFSTAAGFTALAGSMTLFAGAGLLALPALLALTAFNAVTGAGGGGEEDNKIEQLLTEQNQKLDMMNNQLKTIKSNTKRGADEAKGFSDLVTFA
tara:strand:+ start:1853 stop:4708 length:2856 start_codon:yes stop_codon:yes gene_type:complete